MSLQYYEFSFMAMGTRCHIAMFAQNQHYANSAYDKAVREIVRLEKKYSRFTENSYLSKINSLAQNADGFEVDNETAAILNLADTAYNTSDGLFDITSCSLSALWFGKNGRIPDKKRLKDCLSAVGWHKVRWDGQVIRLMENMLLDVGGIVKEYAGDAVHGILRAAGVAHALIDMGGDMFALGPHPDDKPWRIGIKSSTGKAARFVDLYRGALASSGSYERFIEVDGIKYCHIINPITGWPCKGLNAVSVIADQLVIAGIVATTAMLKQSDGKAWLKRLNLPYLWEDDTGLVFAEGI